MLTEYNETTNLPTEDLHLLYFSATWCQPCKQQHPEVERLAEAFPDTQIFKVNVDDHPDLAASFGISSVPTILFLKGKQILHRFNQLTHFTKLEAALKAGDL